MVERVAKAFYPLEVVFAKVPPAVLEAGNRVELNRSELSCNSLSKFTMSRILSEV
jgi:hypothetical protein